jgi:hypothetical protein
MTHSFMVVVTLAGGCPVTDSPGTLPGVQQPLGELPRQQLDEPSCHVAQHLRPPALMNCPATTD